ncbi:hypothetical protein LTR56_005808 [Elasticomyces elasticus]|nr:hypothetical protein LTR22_019434 [Elasticomyces elasticus]KAK3651351.1 hypothetical protein LTR56_005808 [Elasticomyces elasticus]KAK4925739.1 hypothetical protein LTR49_007349 [Elasticomyces elasticus]KAK5765071.1 hypothetical protein LTS12_004849 [Elasticomyces elasticus]
MAFTECPFCHLVSDEPLVIQAHIEEEHAETPHERVTARPSKQPPKMDENNTLPEKRQTRASTKAKSSLPEATAAVPPRVEVVEAPKPSSVKAKATAKTTAKTTANKPKAKASKSKRQRSDSAEPSGTDHFTKLPPELRNRVYELVIPCGERVLGPWTEPSILCVSKQIRRETSPIYYKHNEFTQRVRFEVFDTGKRVHGEPGGRFKAAVRKLASIVKICGVHPFGKFRFQFTGEVTRYIAHVLPLLDLMRSGFEPEDEIDEAAEEQTYASIFIPLPPTFGNSNLLASFERAVRLGQRAREQEWEEEKLKERFQTMLSNVAPDLYPRDIW